tara:strand:- start:1355 stop:2818 length:1464 start_codon:yes stop_codon:yes gene_type:complete
MFKEYKTTIKGWGKRKIVFINLEANLQEKIKLHQQVKIKLEKNKREIIFYQRIREHRKKGFYIPQKLVEKYQLLEEEVIVKIKKCKGFFTKTSSDGRIYIPKEEVQKFKLKRDNIVLITVIIDKKEYLEYCRIRYRKRKNTREYFCMFHPKLKNKQGIFEIKRVISKKKEIGKIKRIIKKFDYGIINKKRIILFYGNSVPVIIEKDINFRDIVYYLGCYYADGTKRGNSWAICASTFEQAKYYLKKHKELVEDPKLNFELSYTDPNNEDKEQLKKKLIKIWKERTGVVTKRVYIHKAKIKNAKNRNKYGSLHIKENRQLVLLYYNSLLENIISVCKKEPNFAREFLNGIFEGDGSPDSHRGGIIISSNKEEVKPIRELFRRLDYRNKPYKEKENKYYIRVGAIEIIENIFFLKDQLFKYYPKRRKRLIERLCYTPTALFLTGEKEKTSTWILKRFREKNILNQNNKLTQKGRKIKNALIELKKELKQ